MGGGGEGDRRRERGEWSEEEEEMRMCRSMHESQGTPGDTAHTCLHLHTTLI